MDCLWSYQNCAVGMHNFRDAVSMAVSVGSMGQLCCLQHHKNIHLNLQILVQNLGVEDSSNTSVAPMDNKGTGVDKSSELRTHHWYSSDGELAISPADKNFIKWGRKHLGEKLGTVLLQFSEGVAHATIIKYSKCWMCEYLFHPWRPSRATTTFI